MNKPDLEYWCIKDYLSHGTHGTQEDVQFCIPVYQRPYSWDMVNCERLWQDIDDIENTPQSKYFFGTIIINELNKENGASEYWLIDGQQRTITFFLLLKALLESVDAILRVMDKDNKKEGEEFHDWRDIRKDIMNCLYKIDRIKIDDIPNVDNDKKIYENFLSEEIFQNNTSDPHKEDFKSILLYYPDYNTNNQIVNKPEVIEKKWRHGDNRYTNYYRNYKYFKDAISQKRKQADNSLRTMVHKILDKCQIIQIKTTNAEDQAIAMFNSLNSKGMPLCDSDIIHATLYANAKTKSNAFEDRWNNICTIASQLEEADVFRAEAGLDSLLYQYMYCLRARAEKMLGNVTTPGLRRYFMDLDGKGMIQNPLLMCDDLLRLADCWENIKDNTLLKVLLKFNENSRLFLACYLFRFKNPKEDICEENLNLILESLLRLFVLLAVGEAGYSSNQFKTFLFNEASKLCDSKISEAEIADDFNKHIEKWRVSDIEAQIKVCERNSLVYLNEYLTDKSFNLDLKRCNIEHIMPQSGRKPTMEHIRNDAKLSNPEEFEAHVNKLGNKILLESNVNESIGNDWFRSKVQGGYCKSGYPLAQKLCNDYGKSRPFWTKDDINDATNSACKRIVSFIYPTDQA